MFNHQLTFEYHIQTEYIFKQALFSVPGGKLFLHL